MTDAATVVLVEGTSDRIALEAAAARVGRDLGAERVAILVMGGASALGDYLEDLLGRQGFAGRLAGLCDEGEVADFTRGLERAGLGSGLDRAGMEALGFFVCVADLEDELIRAAGVGVVEAVIEDAGELRSLRILQNQPAWRGRAADAQMRRFMGSRSGRKARYARLLVEAVELERIPQPLLRVLKAVA